MTNTKADREVMKSDDLLKREFKADMPCEKCVSDIICSANGGLSPAVKLFI